jgi:hypothetical protein
MKKLEKNFSHEIHPPSKMADVLSAAADESATKNAQIVTKELEEQL